MKSVVWIGDAKDEVRAFPDTARQAAGFQLNKVQSGEEPDDWKPMSAIGAGVCEIRIRERAGVFRVIYVAHFADAIYVLHAFRKTTQKTSIRDIELARSRLRAILR